MIASSTNYWLNLADITMGAGTGIFTVFCGVFIAGLIDEDDSLFGWIALTFLLLALLCLAGCITLRAA